MHPRMSHLATHELCSPVPLGHNTLFWTWISWWCQPTANKPLGMDTKPSLCISAASWVVAAGGGALPKGASRTSRWALSQSQAESRVVGPLCSLFSRSMAYTLEHWTQNTLSPGPSPCVEALELSEHKVLSELWLWNRTSLWVCVKPNAVLGQDNPSIPPQEIPATPTGQDSPSVPPQKVPLPLQMPEKQWDLSIMERNDLLHSQALSCDRTWACETWKWKWNCSVVSNFLQPPGLNIACQSPLSMEFSRQE